LANLPWEDSLLERKLESDLKDLLKILVAFANSVRPGHVAQILIGERNDGSPQGVRNADNIQKMVRDTCNRIYPPILWRTQVYEREGKTCI
jgi:predicted HTH transcriptional regulator